MKEFTSFEGLAQHLLNVAAPAEIEAASRYGLNDAAKLIKADARAQIGVYQAQVGNYPQWAQLAESTEDEKARLGAPPDAPLLRYGDLQKSFRSSPEGADSVIVGSTDPNMEWHEFGTSKMPPRPVVGPALFKNLENIQEILGTEVEAVISGQRLGYRFDKTGGIGPLGSLPEDENG